MVRFLNNLTAYINCPQSLLALHRLLTDSSQSHVLKREKERDRTRNARVVSLCTVYMGDNKRGNRFTFISTTTFNSRQKMVDFLDLTLLKDMVYLNIVLGISFALYSDNAFFTLQPMYLFELGFSKVKRFDINNCYYGLGKRKSIKNS